MRFGFIPVAMHEANMDPHEYWTESNAIPLVQIAAPHNRKLAIVGAGPSIQHKLDKLRGWKGDIWAINATVGYLASKGIKSTLATIDPIVLDEDDFNQHKGAEGALLAASCDPKLFQAYKGRVKAFYSRPNTRAPFVASGGGTTATRLPMLAVRMGYRDVTFFGCEGSYENSSHIHDDRTGEKRIYIKAGVNRYCTEPHMMAQGEWLSDLIIKYPQGFREESGGLLRAMIKHRDWSVVGVSNAMKQHLERAAA